jgi:hypothetical protein
MHCRTARSWILSRQDAPITADRERELAAHTAICAACATYAGDFATLQEWTAALVVEEPSPQFEWRLKLRLATLEREARRADDGMVPRRSLRHVFEFGGALAAAAAVVVAIGLSQQEPQTPAPVAPPASALTGGQVTPLRDMPGPQLPTAAQYSASAAFDSAAADSLR